MDNVRFHHSNDDKIWCDEEKVLIKFLPPYSLDLNPIENVFSTIKSRYSAIRPLPSTSTMIKEYVGEVIRKMNKDPEIVYKRYCEKNERVLEYGI